MVWCYGVARTLHLKGHAVKGLYHLKMSENCGFRYQGPEWKEIKVKLHVMTV